MKPGYPRRRWSRTSQPCQPAHVSAPVRAHVRLSIDQHTGPDRLHLGHVIQATRYHRLPVPVRHPRAAAHRPSRRGHPADPGRRRLPTASPTRTVAPAAVGLRHALPRRVHGRRPRRRRGVDPRVPDHRAAQAADQLGQDANHLWTAFGPTNVAIHRVATAAELGDVQVALDLGPRVDTTALPMERRVRHALEVARAYSAWNRIDEALTTVLDAERIAPNRSATTHSADNSCCPGSAASAPSPLRFWSTWPAGYTSWTDQRAGSRAATFGT